MADKIIVEVDSALEDIVGPYLENRKQEVIELEADLKKSDFSAIEVKGHKVRGNAGGYGFEDLGSLGEKLEKLAQEQNQSEIADCIKQMQDYLSRVEVKFVED